MELDLVQVLRLVHILCGAFWLGCAVTLGFFVAPALLNGEVLGAQKLKHIMVRGRLGVILPVVVILAIVSGLWLYRIDFPHMQMQHLTPRALDYTLGGFLAIIAFVVGISINSPTGSKIAVLADAMDPAAPTASQDAELVRLSRKLLISARATGILTLGAGAFMALARYTR
jgi:uncharacterized membrane protein